METVTSHGMYSFKDHDLRGGAVHATYHLLQVKGVVVTEYVFGNATVPDALDQRGVIPFFREHVNTWI